MIRITRESDYAIVLMSILARDPHQAHSASALAEARGLPLPMVSKILKILARAGLLDSRRGAHGGYNLARDARDISLAEIVAALEGPIALTACSPGGGGECAYQDDCRVSPHWSRISRAIADALEGISLQEMSQPPRAVVRRLNAGTASCR